MSFIESKEGEKLLGNYLKSFQGKSSLKVYRAEIKSFFRFFSGDINDLSQDHIKAYRDHLVSKGLTEKTLARKFSILNGFFHFLESNLSEFQSPIGHEKGDLQQLNFSRYVESQGFKNLLSDFLSTIRSQETVNTYKSQITIFFRWLSGIREISKPDDLQPDDFQRYKDFLITEGRKTATILNKFLSLSSFLKFCFRDPSRNPLRIRDLKLPPMPKGQNYRSTMTDHEVELLLSMIDTDTLIGKRDYIMIYLMFFYGLRKSEVCKLLWRDVLERISTERGESLTIRIAMRKGSLKNTELPLSDKLLTSWDNWITSNQIEYAPDTPVFLPFCHHPKTYEITLDYNRIREKEPLDTETVTKRLHKYLKKSGIKKGRRVLSPHSLRHTAVTRMRKAGVPDTTIAYIMGHSDVKMLQIYDNPEFNHDTHFDILKNVKML